jgi:thymidylate synthase (FAD)
MGDDQSVVNAARVSYGQDRPGSGPLSPRDAKLIRYLLAHDHGSPFEHNAMTFKVVAPIFVLRQWMRHRIASYNEISARYSEVQDLHYRPQVFRAQATGNKQASVESPQVPQEQAASLWQAAWQESYLCYQKLLALGVAREQARGVLPTAMYSEMYFSCNLRALFHFLELRDHPGAQWEIRQYAKALEQLGEPIFPVCFAAWREARSAR